MTGEGAWRRVEPRRLATDDPAITLAAVPAGPGPLMARFVAGLESAVAAGAIGQTGELVVSADLVFHLVEGEA